MRPPRDGSSWSAEELAIILSAETIDTLVWNTNGDAESLGMKPEKVDTLPFSLRSTGPTETWWLVRSERADSWLSAGKYSFTIDIFEAIRYPSEKSAVEARDAHTRLRGEVFVVDCFTRNCA